MSRFQKVDLAYKFLVEKEKAGESFTIDQLAKFTGWKEQSCRTYPSKIGTTTLIKMETNIQPQE
ncbi:hypothetical protein IC611_01955 [Proteus mirabilis]